MPIFNDDIKYKEYQKQLSLEENQRNRVILDGTTEFKMTLLSRALERALSEIETLKAQVNP